jgi:hypothetical protein
MASHSISESERRINNPPQDAILPHKGQGTRPSKTVAEKGGVRECITRVLSLLAKWTGGRKGR